MSIIIKQDRINLLIYKYLLESGLKHSAFSLLHEANLEELSKENQNLSSKLLINYLEKALLFNQIEAHLYKNEHMECNEPFELLVPHSCKITEMKKQEKLNLLNQYNHELNNIITEEEPAQQNQNQQVAIVLEKPNITITQAPQSILSNQTEFLQNIKISDTNVNFYTICEKNSKIATYSDGFDYISIWKLNIEEDLPQNSLVPESLIYFKDFECNKEDLVFFEWDGSDEFLMIAFSTGKMVFLTANYEVKTVLNMSFSITRNSISWNSFCNETLAITSENNIFIINPFTQDVVSSRSADIVSLTWQNQENYAILTKDNTIDLINVLQESPLQQFRVDEETSIIKFSRNGIFISALSIKTNSIKVWLMNSNEYLYSFHDEDNIIDFIWNDEDTSDFFNFIVAAFQKSIRVFDIEYGTLKHKIDITEKVNIKQLLLFNKDTMITTFLQNGSISVYSLNNHKKLYQASNDSEISNIQKVGDLSAIGFSNNNVSLIRLRKIF